MQKELDRIILDINVKAPSFDLTDIFDRQIKLEDYKGKKVFIGFFRHAGCPFCNLRVHFLQGKQTLLRSMGMEMIFFFESSQKTLLTSTFHTEVSPIPLIADPEKEWYHTYGIEDSTGKSNRSHLTSFIQTAIKAKINGVPMHLMKDGESYGTMPAEFLIDEDQIIRRVHYSKGLNDRMAFQHIADFASNSKS